MKKIGIIGYGYVGKAIESFLKSHYQVSIYDIACPATSKQSIKDANVAFVCVPTPSLEGRCDTSIVEEVVDWCEAELIIIKSTVEPGTTDRLRQKTNKKLVFAPEYCGESSYWSPYEWDRNIKETPFFIFGGEPEDTKQAVDLYLPIVGPTKKYIQTSAKAAEMAKYVTNAFASTKITFCYEIASVCEKANLDFNLVRELWLMDPRVNPMHTAVFADNKYPFGGKCLPKDTQALINYAESVGYNPQLLKEVIQSNNRIGNERTTS